MNFIEYYQSLKPGKDRKKLRDKINETTYTSYPTFFGWIRRKKFPPLVQEKICEILQKPQSELFPEHDETNSK